MLTNIIKNKTALLWFIIILWFFLWWSSLNNIPKEDSPEINLPIFIINTAFPWWNPVTIENNITNKLEDELKSISGIKKIESVSNFNFSTIIVTFNDNKNLIDAKLELTDAINNTSLPTWTSRPIYKQVKPDDSPIYSFSISGNLFEKEIYEKVKKLENDLKTIAGISEIKIIWKPEKNINIYLDEKKINEFWIDIKNVKNLLANSFLNQSIWKKDIWWSLYSYELETFPKNLNSLLEQLKQTDLINVNSQSVKLKDLAEIFLEENSKIEKSFVIKDKIALNSISFDIKISPGNDAESIIKQVLQKIEDFKTENPDLKIFETFSKLTEINDVFNTFYSNFRQSWLIILVILFLFIGFRISLWVTIAFPLVYMLTFICLTFLWYSFNNVVSFWLVLTLWIMVDNLIVITEWMVQEFKNNKNIDFWEALKNTFKNYNSSILAWTLTTISIFIPLLFLLSGTVWKFIAPLSITIIVTLSVSVFVAIFLLPLILKKVLPKNLEHSETYFWKKLENFWDLLSKFSIKFTKNKFSAFLTVILFWVIFIFSLALVWLWAVKTDFMPATDRDNIWINIKFPSGFSNENTKQETNKILQDITEFFEKNYKNDIEYFYVNIWNIYNTSPVSWAANITADNQAYINIKLVKLEKRTETSYKITEKLQDFIDKSVKTKYSSIKDIFTISGISLSWWKEIWFHIIWEDLKEISKYLEKISPQIEKINWLYNLNSSLEFTNWKIKYFIDTNKTIQNWTSLESIILLLSSIKNSNYQPNWILLKTFTEFWKDDVNLNLFTKYDWSIEDLKIWDNFTSSILKEKTLAPELKNISHIDWNLQISLEADKKSRAALSEITKQIDKIIEKNPLPKGLSFKYNSNISDQAQSQKDLGKALWVWVLLMFMVLIFQFNSFWVSLIVLTSTLLSIIWIIFFLWIFELPLSFPAQLWLFWVIWVWVNNSILFTDLYNTKQKINIKKDLKETIKSRFSAIFLTTFTTIAGLITLAIKDELWWSLAIAFIWWLLVNILIVLVYLPSFYFLIEKEKK